MCCAVVTLGIFTSIINGVADDAEDMGAQGLSGFRDLYVSGRSEPARRQAAMHTISSRLTACRQPR